MFVDFNILNQLGSPSINSNTFANRPAAGQTGRLFVSTDTFEIFRDNGTGWDLIGGPGAGTITGTGTATQVAYFTGSQTIGSSANLFWDNTAGALGINTATPGAELDIHGTGIIVQLNSTSATANSLLAFQRSGSGVWRIGDQYNGGSNFFELHNTVLTNNAIQVTAANNKSTFTALETYASGLATGNQFTYNLTVPNGVNITSPNAVGAVNSYLNLSLGGNTTVPSGARQGLEGNSRISFTGAGTLTMTQGSTVRAFSALSSVYSFAGSAVGTVTHLAGLRICFPDNLGSAINITNNYGLLLNDQTAGLGTVTYTNRWGIYQEGASDLNYFNGNLLVKTTTNAGYALDVNGLARVLNRLDVFNGINVDGPTAASRVQIIPPVNSGFNNYIFIDQPSTRFYLQRGNSDGGAVIQRPQDNNGEFRFISSTSNVSLGFYTFRNTAGEMMRLASTGNLLIGTTTDAGFRLDVTGSLRFGANNTSNDVLGSLNFQNGSNAAYIQQSNSTSRSLQIPGTGGESNWIFRNTGIGRGLQGQFNSGNFLLLGDYLSFTTTLFPGGGIQFIGASGTQALNNKNIYIGNTTVIVGDEKGYNIRLLAGTGGISGGDRVGGDIFLTPGLGGGAARSGYVVLAHTGTATQGNVGVGTATPVASALVDITSTTQGFLPPRMTTAQKNAIAAPANGLVIYDTTLAKLCVFTGVNWETVTSV